MQVMKYFCVIVNRREVSECYSGFLVQSYEVVITTTIKRFGLPPNFH